MLILRPEKSFKKEYSNLYNSITKRHKFANALTAIAVTVLASHVTWSRALARHRRCGAAELVIYIRTEPCK
jgi:hypothetical protein